MAQHFHVPKFSNWDDEDVPYTTFFNNAHKEKGNGVKLNPNDPEENPGTFIYGRGGHETEAIQPTFPRAPSFGVASDKMLPVTKHHIEEHLIREQGPSQHNPAHQRGALDQQKTINHKIDGYSELSNSDKSSSDHALQQLNHRRARSDRKKNLAEGSNSFSPSSPGHTGLRIGNHQADDMQRTAASVPKFGAWDETDPKSGAGFTVIFNRVREEKKIGVSKFPTVPPQPGRYSRVQKNHGSDSSRSKVKQICCCLFSKSKKK